jgi:hypothetical protein
VSTPPSSAAAWAADSDARLNQEVIRQAVGSGTPANAKGRTIDWQAVKSRNPEAFEGHTPRQLQHRWGTIQRRKTKDWTAAEERELQGMVGGHTDASTGAIDWASITVSRRSASELTSKWNSMKYRQSRRWSPGEDDSLRAGVAAHAGAGAVQWSKIAVSAADLAGRSPQELQRRWESLSARKSRKWTAAEVCAVWAFVPQFRDKETGTIRWTEITKTVPVFAGRAPRELMMKWKTLNGKKTAEWTAQEDNLLRLHAQSFTKGGKVSWNEMMHQIPLFHGRMAFELRTRWVVREYG